MQLSEIRLVSLIGLLFFMVTPFAQAVDTGNMDSLKQDLHYKLQQRDQVILELLERVEALEKELGVVPARSKTADTADEQAPVVATPAKTKSAPGLVVVDESMAERALERSLTGNGVLLLPSGVFEIEPRLTYARQEDTTPGFVMSGGNVIASETERNSNSLAASLLLRLGLPGDSQLEIGIPYRWREIENVTNVGFTPADSSSQSGNGVGDVRITLAKTFLREDVGLADVIGRLTWDTDTGDVSDNGVSIGGGFHEVQAALSFIKRQDPVVFVSGLSYEYTFEENSIQPGDVFAANFGSYFALNPQTSLSFGFSMAYQKETDIAGSKLEGSDRTLGTFSIGGSTLLARGTLLNLTVGVGLTDDANDFSVALSLPMR